MSPGPYSGLTGSLPRDPTTGAVLISASQYDRDDGFPGILAPGGRGWSFTTSAVTAQRLLFMRFVPSRDMSITQLAFAVSTADTVDNAVHVGVYDSALNLLITSGAVTGKLNAAGVSTVPLVISLTARSVYYAAFLVPTITTSLAIVAASFGLAATHTLFGANAPQLWGGFKNTLTVLPNPLTATTTVATVGVIALRES